MAFTEFFCNHETGNNHSAGSKDGAAEPSAPLLYRGTWVQATRVLTVAAPGNYAASFVRASSQVLTALNHASLQVADTDFWWAGWVYIDVTGQNQMLVFKGPSVGVASPYMVQLISSDVLRFQIGDGSSGNWVDSGALSGSTWHFFFCWHDSVANTINVRVNDGATVSAAWTTGAVTETNSLSLGGGASTGGRWLDGRIDSLAFGKSPPGGFAATPGATISGILYNAGAGLRYDGVTSQQKTDWGLVSWWDMDEASGQIRTDSHGGNNSSPSASSPAQAAGVTSGGSAGNPSSDGVAVGDFAALSSTNNFGADAIGRVTARDATTITLHATALSGTYPANGTYNLRVGGPWRGPYSSSGFPFGFITASLMNTSSHPPRTNLKNNETYRITAAMSHSSAGTAFWGYQTTPEDGGRAVIDGTITGASYILLTAAVNSGNFAYLEFCNNGTTGSAAAILASQNTRWLRCVAHDVRGNGFTWAGADSFIECEAYACNQSNTAQGAGFYGTPSLASYLDRCISHDNVGSNSSGFNASVGTGILVYSRCIADSNGADGFAQNSNGSISMHHCDAYNNGGDGVDLTFSGSVRGVISNCNFVKNGGYGFNGGANFAGLFINCGFGSGTQANTSGTYTSTSTAMVVVGTVTYAADVTPWVDPANGDFRINLAAAKGAGRGTFLQTATGYSGTVGYPDIGAAQHLETTAPIIITSHRKVR